MGLIAYFSLDGVGVARGAGRKYLSQGIMGDVSLSLSVFSGSVLA